MAETKTKGDFSMHGVMKMKIEGKTEKKNQRNNH